MARGNIYDRDAALFLFKDGLNFKQVAKRLGCGPKTASKIRWELMARGKFDDPDDPLDRELEEQSFRNIVTFYADELRDMHEGRKSRKDAIKASSRALFRHGAIHWKRELGYKVTEKALRVLEEDGGKRDGL